MADTRIPLSVQPLDIANPLMMLQQRERQATQDQRQTRLDDLAMTESGQRQEVNKLNIEGLKKQLSQIDPQALKSGLQSIAVDSFAVQDMLKQGDTEGAALLAQEIKATSSSLGLPAREIDNFVNLLGNNPQAASQYWDRQVQVVRQNMPALFETVNGPNGQPVAQRNTQNNQLTPLPQGMAQPNQLDAYLQQLEVKQAELGVQNTQQQIQTRGAEAEVKQAENAQRAQSVGTEAQRAYTLAGSLLGNESGLKGATGPVSGRLPSFRESTTTFEADLKELENLLTLGNLGRMTGVLSESDIRILANAASGISTVASEDRMREKLGQIQERLSANPAVMEMLQNGNPANSFVGGQQQVGRFTIEVLN